MATRTWIGGTNGTWTETTNWLEAAAPGNGDDVVIDHGSQDIDGIDQSAVTLNSMTVGPNYTGTIASSGTPLWILGGDLVFDGASCNAWIKGTWSDVHVQDTPTGTGNNGLTLSTDTGTGDDIDNLHLTRGKITVASSSQVGNIYVGYRTTQASDVSLIIESGVTISGTIDFNGGVTTCSSNVGTVRQSSGTVTLDDGTVTSWKQYGGTFYWDSTDTNTLVDFFGGTFDASRVLKARTLTTLNVRGPGTVKITPILLTVTNENIHSREAIVQKAVA